MNDYELSALEGRDLYCEQCGKYISLNEYIDNEGLCNICAEEVDWVKKSKETNYDRTSKIYYKS